MLSLLSRVIPRTTRPAYYRVAAMLSIAAGLIACNPDTPTSPRDVSTGSRLSSEVSDTIPSLQPGDSAAVDSLARAFAVALSNSDLRQKVHNDFRDSPFPLHRIHFPSYLNGKRGSEILSIISQKTGWSAARIKALASRRGGLQVSVPRAFDRMFWTATQSVTVVGTALTIPERRAKERALLAGGQTPQSATNFNGGGVASLHSLGTESRDPFILISPAQIDFGADAERTRENAIKQTRSTVSTSEDEIRLYKARGDSSLRAERAGFTPRFIDVCDPDDPTLECNSGTPSRPMGVSLPSGKAYWNCYQPGAFSTAVDGDQDGIDDACEAELAIAFRPQLVFDAWDCELAREPHFAARQKVSADWGGVILLFYAISYRHDCGPYGHNGDSEWIILEVGQSTNPTYAPWSLKYGTLSAHWRAENDNTAGYEASDLEDAVGSPGFGAPRVWVSVGKHANYRTQTSCNTSGFWWNWDNCDHPLAGYHTLEFSAAQNLGQVDAQFIGGSTTPVASRLISSSRLEYFWAQVDFCGWFINPDYSCASPYRESLRAYGY